MWLEGVLFLSRTIREPTGDPEELSDVIVEGDIIRWSI